MVSPMKNRTEAESEPLPVSLHFSEREFPNLMIIDVPHAGM
jgi:hypothetical protein